MKARVFVTLKNGVLDPQGKAIGNALHGLGFGQVGQVRQGKSSTSNLKSAIKRRRRPASRRCAEKLLANTVIEKYEIELK